MKPISRVTFNLGAIAIIIGLGAVHASRYDYSVTGTFRFPWLIGFTFIVVTLAYGIGVPDVGDAARGSSMTLLAMAGSIGVVSAVQVVLGTPLLPRFVLFGAMAAVPVWGAFATAIAGAGRRQQAARDRVFAIVSTAEGERLAADLVDGLEREVTLVGTADPALVISAESPLRSMVEAVDATILVLGREVAEDDSVLEQAAELHSAGLRVRPLLSFYEEWVAKLPVAELRRSSLLFDISDVHRRTYRRASRGIDLLIALITMPVLAVCVPFVLLGNLLGNRGPLVFRQSRVGRDGKLFDILKLRTMKPGSGSTEWTAEGDARITSFGRFLRTTHVDELPQIVNVIRGDLSIVGPRPEQPHYVEQLKESIPFYDRRHVVRPGLTGWAQVNYRYGNTEFDALEKLQFEFYYLRHQSIWLDLRIIARTLRSVVGLKGK